MIQRLAIDPGYSNGWAVFNDQEYFASGTVPDGTGFMVSIAAWTLLQSDRVIIERIPTRGLGQHSLRLERVLTTLDIAFPNAIWVLPGQWKPLTGHSVIGVPTRTIHERDAIRMVLYDLKVFPG